MRRSAGKSSAGRIQGKHKNNTRVEHSAVGHFGRAPRRAGCLGRDQRAWAVQRCVFPDRPVGDHRARGEERHSDRGAARELFQQGASLADAAMEAARLRLRPILMTSLGLPHRRIAAGDKYRGGFGQNAIGTGVMGGTFAATVLGIFFVPVFSSWSSACSTGRLGKSQL